MVPEGHVQRSRKPRRAEKSKDKGKRSKQRRIAKRRHDPPIQRRIAKDLQITKLGDDQERRAKWRKTEGRE